MNILFLMVAFEIGGQETVTATLADCFIKHGHSVVIACFKNPNEKMLERLDPIIKFINLGGFNVSKQVIRNLKDVLLNHKIDVVINQWGLPYQPAYALNKARKGLNVRVISVYHNQVDTNSRIKDIEIALEHTDSIITRLLLHAKKKIMMLVTSLSMRYVYNSSDKYIVLSSSYLDKFKSFTGVRNLSKLEVLTNPITIDSSDYKYQPSTKNKEIIYVGRINNNQKRASRLIDVWNCIENKYPDWKFTIVGDGSEKKTIEQKAKDLNLQRVSFEGFKSPIEYYRRASILLLVSEYEGFPLVIAEAMSFGLVPVVYESYSAASDIINDNINGILIPYCQDGFHANHMATRLCEIMDNNSKLTTMQFAAIEKSKQYSIMKIYYQWLEILK